MKSIKWLVVLILLFIPWLAWAESETTSPVSAETHVSERLATVGDLLTYSIVVRHDKGIHIAAPDPTEHFAQGFELVDRGTSEPKELGGQAEETFWFKLRADRVGFYNLPPIPVSFTAPSPDDPSRAIPGTLMAPEAVIEIRSVLFIDDQAQDIKDIKPIVGAGYDWRKFMNWVYIIVGIALVVGFFFWWIQRRKSSPAPAAPVPDLKPHEVALADLERLVARQWIESERFREHYFELSEIFRRYLGTFLSIPALDWTSEEIAAFMARQPAIDSGVKQTILTLLPATDQVKFAQAPVDPQTALHHVEAVRDFIIQSVTPKIKSKYQIKSETAPLRAGRT